MSSEEQSQVILAHTGTEQLCKYFAFIRQMMQLDKLIPLGKPWGGRQCQPKVPRGRWSLLYRGRAFAPPEGLVR